MRLMLMFDLPTKSKEEKKSYLDFHKFLLRDGYDMLQFSIYTRLCPNLDAVDTHIGRLKKIAPQKGAVRTMIVTNKQFSDGEIVTGHRTRQEKRINHDQFLLF